MDDDPVILLSPLHDGDPRLLDTVFNVSSLTSGIFNNSLFQYAGLVIVGIILFGEIYVELETKFCEDFTIQEEASWFRLLHLRHYSKQALTHNK